MQTRCPAPPELLLIALESAHEPEAPATTDHLRGCTSCRMAILQLRESASVLQSAPQASSMGECLDEMSIARLAEHGATDAELRDRISHLAACATCRETLASVTVLLRDPAVAAESDPMAGVVGAHAMRRWRVTGVGVLAAAAAVVKLMVSTPVGRMRGADHQIVTASTETHREQGVTTTVAPTLIAPIGVTQAADSFTWASVPKADRYRLTLFDREGTMLWQAEGTDTAMAAPRSLVIDESATLLWKVEARTGWDRWVESELVEFSRVSAKRIP
jgi:predicted anti-sigma-YlaC factor YlaD